MDTTARTIAELLEGGELTLSGARAEAIAGDLAERLELVRDQEKLRPHVVKVRHPFEDIPAEPVIAWQERDDDGELVEYATPDPDSDDGIAYGAAGRRYIGPDTCPDCGLGLDARIVTNGATVQACVRLVQPGAPKVNADRARDGDLIACGLRRA